MSTKENAAVSQLLALLEARYALRVLWALRDGHAQTFRLLQDSVGGITPNTLNTRIKELREAGIVSHGSDGYCLTLSGQDLLKRLSDLQAFAGKWQLGQLKKAAVPATPAPVAPAAPVTPPAAPPPPVVPPADTTP
jgi:DNA-binding HxlR family transcriptional regulator